MFVGFVTQSTESLSNLSTVRHYPSRFLIPLFTHRVSKSKHTLIHFDHLHSTHPRDLFHACLVPRVRKPWMFKNELQALCVLVCAQFHSKFQKFTTLPKIIIVPFTLQNSETLQGRKGTTWGTHHQQFGSLSLDQFKNLLSMFGSLQVAPNLDVKSMVSSERHFLCCGSYMRGRKHFHDILTTNITNSHHINNLMMLTHDFLNRPPNRLPLCLCHDRCLSRRLTLTLYLSASFVSSCNFVSILLFSFKA